MPLKLVPTTQFKKDLKRIGKRGYDLGAFEIVLNKSLKPHEAMITFNQDSIISIRLSARRICKGRSRLTDAGGSR